MHGWMSKVPCWCSSICWYPWPYWPKNSLSTTEDPAREGGLSHVCWTESRINIAPSLLHHSVHRQAQSTERCETQCAALPITHWHGSVLHSLPHWGSPWQPHQDVFLPGGKKEIEKGLLLLTKHRDDEVLVTGGTDPLYNRTHYQFEAPDYQPSKQTLCCWSCWTADSSWAPRSQKH